MKLFARKRGLELTINFIVMLILAITVLGFGIFFANKLFFSAEEMRENIDAETRAEIEALLNDGARFAIPFTTQEVKKQDVAYFGAGVLNILGATKEFVINVEYGSGYRDDRTTICEPNNVPTNCNSYLDKLYASSAFSVAPNEQETKQIAIKPKGNAEKGTYSFNVYVCYDNPAICDNTAGTELYDFKKIYVKVR